MLINNFYKEEDPKLWSIVFKLVSQNFTGPPFANIASAVFVCHKFCLPHPNCYYTQNVKKFENMTPDKSLPNYLPSASCVIVALRMDLLLSLAIARIGYL